MTGPHQTTANLAPPILVLALSLAATAAVAEDKAPVPESRLEMAFGSTIVSTYPDGRQAELWLKRDGTYDAEGRRHDRTGGTWQLKSDKGGMKLCLKQQRPFAAPPFFSYCPEVPEGGIDKPWMGKAFTGESITIRLVRGIYDPAKGGKPEGAAKAQAARRDDEG